MREHRGRPLLITAPSCVGRDRQLRQLTELLAEGSAVVLLAGEAGIGKSRLVQEFLRQRSAPPVAGGAAAADGLPRVRRPLVGVCPPYQEPSTLTPIVDALRSGPESLAGLSLPQSAGALRPLFPEWADTLPPSPPWSAPDPWTGRRQLFEALAGVIHALRAELLVVEDAHWADGVSLEFLRFLVEEQLPRLGLSLIVTYRPEDLPERSPLLQLVHHRSPTVRAARMTLPPLDASATAALVSSMLDGAPVSETVAAVLHEHTDGLPLAVEESVRLLGERADLVRRNGEWVRASLAAMRVPPTVRDATLERIGRQPAPTQRLLRAAAVMAAPAAPAVLAEVAELPLTAAEAEAAVAPAVAAGLLRRTPRGRVAFRHALSAGAVYEALPGPQRRRLHLRAGEVLAGHRPPPAARLAQHFRHGADLERWAYWAEQAADAAVAAGDHLTAAGLLDPLLTVALPLPQRARVVRKCAEAVLFLQGDDPPADRIMAALRGLLTEARLPVAQRAELRTLLGRLLNQQGEHAAAYLELARAVRHLHGAPVKAAQSMIQLGWPRSSPWPASVHVRWLRRAERLAEAPMSAVDRLGLLVDRAAALLQLGAESGWELAEQLPETGHNLAELLHLSRGHLNIGDAAIHWGRDGHARELLQRALTLARTHRLGRVEEITLATLVRLDWFAGAWRDLAVRAAALVEADRVERVAQLEAMLVLGWLALAQGEWEQSAQQLEEVLAEARRRGVIPLELSAAAGLGRLRLDEGDPVAAQRITDAAIELLVGKRIWVWAAELLPVRVEALVRTGQVAAAERLVGAVATGLRGRSAPAPRAALLTSRAVVAAHRGEPARAAAVYTRAIQAWQELPRPYEVLRARWGRVRCRLRVGCDEETLAELTAVHDGLADLGADGDARRVAGELRGHGRPVLRTWRGGRRGYGDQLSPRELEVVRLVAAGRTNREIAEALGKAPGTVAEQVQSAMRKLRVSSRTALAVQAIGSGLVPGRPRVPADE